MAQFSEPPPLDTIGIFIKEVTGCICEIDATWSSWSPGNPEVIDECLSSFRKHYRPCHLKILDETEAGMHSNPCALIRQLLRPHGLTVQFRNKTWKIIRKLKGGVIDVVDTVVDWT
jgi:hypothetical protein